MARKTFNIVDDKVLKWLDKQVNQSQYVVELIRRDMSKNRNDGLSREDVIKIIEEYLSNKKVESKIDIDVLKSAENLFKGWS